MKKMFFIIFVLMLTVNSFAKQSWPMESCPEYCWFQNLVEQNNREKNLTNDDDWILVGEVLLSDGYRQAQKQIKANLYIREVANKIIYRIEYNGKFYAVSKSYSQATNETYYYVTIGNETYYFHVQ